jgi:hypothetical protein
VQIGGCLYVRASAVSMPAQAFFDEENQQGKTRLLIDERSMEITVHPVRIHCDQICRLVDTAP